MKYIKTPIFIIILFTCIGFYIMFNQTNSNKSITQKSNYDSCFIVEHSKIQ